MPKPEELKRDFVNSSKAVLPLIAFASVHNYVDTIFDRKRSKITEQELAFLNSTKLKDISFENTEDLFFTIKNNKTGETIQIANRTPENKEFRGSNIRNYLETEKAHRPDETLLNSLNKAVKTPDYSDLYNLTKSYLTGEAAQKTYRSKMTEEHFTLFSKIVLQRIGEKIANGEFPSDLTVQEVEYNAELQTKIWEGIDLNFIYDATKNFTEKYDATKSFTEKLTELDHKVVKFGMDGNTNAYNAALAVSQELEDSMIDLINNKIDLAQFKKDCFKVIKDNEAELETHRGRPGIFSLITKLFSAIAGLFGKKTDTAEKLHSIKDSLNELKVSDKEEKADSEKSDHHI